MTDLITKEKFESRVEFNNAEASALKELKKVLDDAPMAYHLKKALRKIINNIERIED